MPVFIRQTVPMSIGHFAYQPATAGVGASGFKALVELMRRGNTWMKISGANRVSATDLPPYDDVKPLAHALIEAAPDRIMWGTDWPHPNKYVVNPNDGDLVDAFGDWVTDETHAPQDHGRYARRRSTPQAISARSIQFAATSVRISTNWRVPILMCGGSSPPPHPNGSRSNQVGLSGSRAPDAILLDAASGRCRNRGGALADYAQKGSPLGLIVRRGSRCRATEPKEGNSREGYAHVSPSYLDRQGSMKPATGVGVRENMMGR